MKKSEILKCALNLTKAELKIFMFFFENKGSEYLTEEVSKELGLNLSTVQRAVKKLYELLVLNRRQKNLDTGGYIYIYSIVSKIKCNNIVKEKLVNWYARACGYFG